MADDPTPRPAPTDLIPVTVIVPARNAADTLSLQLEAIAGQDHAGPVEVLVVDNDSTDGTTDVAERWQHRLPDLRVVEARGSHSVAHARNAGFANATHELILVCDADDIADRHWVSTMVAALRDTDIVAGGTLHWLGGELPTGVPLPFGRGGLGFLTAFPGCSFGMHRNVFEVVGDFDERMRSCEDIDFAWRAQLAGFTLVTRPDAFVYYRVDTAPGRVFRKWRHYGTYQPALYAKFRHQGLRRQPLHRSIARWLVLVATSYRMFVGPDDAREAWCREAGRRVGRVIGSIRFRALYL